MTSVQHLVSHRWRVAHESFAARTDDGVAIEGTRVGDPRPDRPAVVMAHGLMGWHRKPRFAVFAELLSHWFTAYPFDLRGHGASGGVSDFGGAEIHDLRAVVAHARAEGHATVVTLGSSLGAIAAIRHAALLGGVDGVVAVSSLASWDWHGEAHPAVLRRFRAQVETVAGREALRLLGVRLTDRWTAPESPEEVVGKIAPAPVVIVHGEDDRLFAVSHARRLYAAANEPKRLLLGEPFGHAEDGLTAAFAARIARVIHEEVGLPWSG
jgi:pimeloyl-ACP methyl ester carboxylesterase